MTSKSICYEASFVSIYCSLTYQKISLAKKLQIIYIALNLVKLMNTYISLTSAYNICDAFEEKTLTYFHVSSPASETLDASSNTRPDDTYLLPCYYFELIF